jgi:two-component system cell cycle sensor histidine kinase/response regulator CckA
MQDPDARIEVDPVQLVHALLNLAINARDAMPEGGRLNIRGAVIAPRPSLRRRYPALRPGPHVEIVIEDTGTGMDADVRTRIFEPFFSTKEVGKGTGLGLAMVYGFIEQSGGIIEVDSTPGEGTSFTILLPQT